jgi:hypothetical protein
MAVIHISEAEAIRDPASFVSRLLAGEEIVLEAGPRALMVKTVEWKDPSIAATLARIKESSERLGYTPVMDADFASDMEEIIRNRKPANRSAWD